MDDQNRVGAADACCTVRIRGCEIGSGMPKVCVPIVGHGIGDILDQAKAAALTSAPILEWRADFFEAVPDSERVREVLAGLREIIGDKVLLCTFRTKSEGGEIDADVEDYVRFGRFVCDTGFADLLDVQLEMGPAVVQTLIEHAHMRRVFVVLSKHDFDGTPEAPKLLQDLRRMQKAGGDILKIAVMPKMMSDVFMLMDTTSRAIRRGIRRPVVTMSMGDMGSISRVAGAFFGSAVTFGTVGKASAPGQLSEEDLTCVLEILQKKADHIRMSPERLFLIGFMGCGKTTMAKTLSRWTGMHMLEMDAALAEEAGMSIPEIFDQEGEQGFRDRETALLRRVALGETDAQIISCGGGAVLRPENVELMRHCGTILLLEVSAATVFRRVGRDPGRPLLANKNKVPEVAELMDARMPIYEAAADIRISVDGKTVRQICDEIMEALCW